MEKVYISYENMKATSTSEIYTIYIMMVVI